MSDFEEELITLYIATVVKKILSEKIIMNYIIESNDELLIEIANCIERIDTSIICIPENMSEKQAIEYLKVRRLLSKARVILENADNIAHTLWSD